MPRYRYKGPGPHITGDNARVFRPGEVYELDGEPDWGPFELVPDEDDGGAQSGPAAPAPPAAQSPAPRAAAQPPARTASAPPVPAAPATSAEGA